jgi:hypothetical protein
LRRKKQLQAISDLEKLFFRVFLWFERVKGPLPIKPAVVIFKEKAGYLDFLRQNSLFLSEQDASSEACTIFKIDSKLEITIAVQNSLSKEPLLLQICILMHELNHVYEETKSGKITFRILEPKNATKSREIATWINSFDLAQKYMGKPLPSWVKDYVFARLKKELI